MPNRRINKKKATKVVVAIASKKGKRKQPKSSRKPTVIGNLLRAGGAALGGYLGGTKGAMMGHQAGGFISRISGQGAYNVKSNSLMAGNVFTFAKETDGELVLCRQEYLGSVYSSTAFSIQTFDINPGLESFLPWGSGIAKLYEQYQLDGCVFEYKSTSGNVSTVQALGDVYFATEYDPTRPVYANKREMLTALYSQECKPCVSLIHPVECARKVDAFGNHRFVRTGDVTTDKRFNDVGRFCVATQGMPSDGEQVGEIWATVKVRLYKPLYAGTLAGSSLQTLRASSGTRNTSWFTTLLADEGADLVTVSGNTFTFLKAGLYCLAVELVVDTGVAMTGALSYSLCTGTATAGPWGETNLFGINGPNAGITCSNTAAAFQITVSAANQTVILPPAIFGAGGGVLWADARAIVIRYAEYITPAAIPKLVKSKDQLDRELQQLMIDHFKQKLTLKYKAETEDEYENLSSVSGSSIPKSAKYRFAKYPQ